MTVTGRKFTNTGQLSFLQEEEREGESSTNFLTL
jgi:hypothetical protein